MSLAGRMQKLLRRVAPKRFYFEDALITTHKHEFVNDPQFRKAYERGLRASEGRDWHNRWRVYLALWVARMCARVDGDFVECGVNYGFTASAIMEDLDWDKLGRQYWLVDSFSGVDEKQATVEEKRRGLLDTSEANKRSGFYNTNVERCRKNFSQWKNAKVLQGWIPDCLRLIPSSKIAFMHIDLNSVVPEVQAFKYFLPKLSRGCFVLLDDYAYAGADVTFTAWNEAARELNIRILALPTGQGLIHIPQTN